MGDRRPAPGGPTGGAFSFRSLARMGKAKKTRKFAEVKRVISRRDALASAAASSNPRNPNSVTSVTARRTAAHLASRKGASSGLGAGAEAGAGGDVRRVASTPASMFFRHNTALGPPYQIIVDTNFINFSIRNKLDIVQAAMDCLCAQVTICVPEPVIAELEKLGQKYRLALRTAKDPRFERLPAVTKGNYADDDIVERVTQHRCYIVATCDRELRRRMRKIVGVPIMYIKSHRFSIERLPEATLGNAPAM